MIAYVSVEMSPKEWSKNTFGWARAEVRQTKSIHRWFPYNGIIWFSMLWFSKVWYGVGLWSK